MRHMPVYIFANDASCAAEEILCVAYY